MAQTFVADHTIDITREVCPMTYVRTRLALDRLQSGQILAVILQGADPLRNVPHSAARQGHTVLGQEAAPGGTVRLLIRRK